MVLGARQRLSLVLVAASFFSFAGCEGEAEVVPRDAGVDAGDAGFDAFLPLDAGPPAPALLSETGLFAEGIDGPLAPGVRAYDVRFPLFTDGLVKRRYLVLPEGGVVDTRDADHWTFPVGTRVFKQFLDGDRPLETRMLWKVGEGSEDWVHVAYVHRADGSDADPTPAGVVDVLDTTHDVPDQEACRQCHRGGTDFVLGIGAMQLARETFDAWIADGALPAGTLFAEPPGTDTERAALGYLHGNCGHCHGEVHPLATWRTMRLWLPVGVTSANNAPAVLTTVGTTANHDFDGVRVIVTPGDPDASQLYTRTGVRDLTQMPPLGTEQVDDVGRAALRAWILGLR